MLCFTPSSRISKSCAFNPRTNWPFCVTITGTRTASVRTCSVNPRSFVYRLSVSRRPPDSVATTRTWCPRTISPGSQSHPNGGRSTVHASRPSTANVTDSTDAVASCGSIATSRRVEPVTTASRVGETIRSVGDCFGSITPAVTTTAPAATAKPTKEARALRPTRIIAALRSPSQSPLRSARADRRWSTTQDIAPRGPS